MQAVIKNSRYSQTKTKRWVLRITAYIKSSVYSGYEQQVMLSCFVKKIVHYVRFVAKEATPIAMTNHDGESNMRKRTGILACFNMACKLTADLKSV